jgi:predicted ATP-grasp superfamily ATP-dependent carboligase
MTGLQAAGADRAAAARGSDGSPDAEAAGFDVLVLDAATKQSLACVRSLGRAGLRVAMAECFAECDPTLPEPAVAFKSRYSARNVVLPSFADDPDAFAGAVVDFVRRYPTRVLIAAMDGSIAAMTPRRAELAALGCVLALPGDDVLAVANDKDRTLELARGLGIAYPRTLRIDTADQIPAVMAEFEYPVVLKPTISWASQDGIRQQPAEAVSLEEADAIARRFLAAGVPVLAQQFASGRREGVSLFVVDGDVRAACGHIAHRTSPQLGGASVMRESTAPSPDLHEAAVSLVKAIGLEGVCEVEFRRDSAGRPLLMEVNARLAGTIENAVHSGVDFPMMIWLWATGQPVPKLTGHKTGVRTRWLHGDLRWLRDNSRRTGRPDSVPVPTSLYIFGSEFARTWHYDCFSWRDRGPAMAELRNSATLIRRSRAAPDPASRSARQ